MELLQKKLNGLLDKYQAPERAVFTGEAEIEIAGERTPLLPWRAERRFVELKRLVEEGCLDKISAVRFLCCMPRGTDLKEVVRRELDLAQWITGSPVEELTAVINGGSANTVCVLQNRAVCTLETSAVLAPGMEIIDKHELIGRGGVACDRAADTQIPQQSIYVFAQGRAQQAFQDVDFELYGLAPAQAALVRQAFAAAKDRGLREALKAEHRALLRLVEAVWKSAQELSGRETGVQA